MENDPQNHTQPLEATHANYEVRDHPGNVRVVVGQGKGGHTEVRHSQNNTPYGTPVDGGINHPADAPYIAQPIHDETDGRCPLAEFTPSWQAGCNGETLTKAVNNIDISGYDVNMYRNTTVPLNKI